MGHRIGTAVPATGAIASAALVLFMRPQALYVGAAIVGAAALWYCAYIAERGEPTE